jgi:antitoxin MazE
MASEKTRIYVDKNVWKELQLDGSEKWYAIEPKSGEIVEIDADQAYFWTEQWQSEESEADDDIAAARTERFNSAAAFLDSLKPRE